jgi:hypothetical protein
VSSNRRYHRQVWAWHSSARDILSLCDAMLDFSYAACARHFHYL